MPLTQEEIAALDKYVQQNMAAPTLPQKPPVNSPSMLESGLRGIGNGASMGYGDELMGAVGAAYARLTHPELFKDEKFADTYKQGRDIARTENENAYQANPKTYALSTIAGGILPAMEGAKVFGAPETLGQVVKQGAVYGGIGGLGNSNAQDIGGMALDTGIGAGIGAGTGAALYGAGKYIVQPAWDKAKELGNALLGSRQQPQTQINLVQALREANQPSGDSFQLDFSKLPQQAQDQLKASGLKNLTPEQMQRMADFEKLGIKNYTIGDVTRNFGDQQFEREIAKDVAAGGPIREANLAKNQQLTAAAEGFQGKLGGATNPYEAGRNIVGTLQAGKQQLDDVISKAYQAADAQAGGAKNINLDTLKSAIDENAPSFLASTEGKSLLQGAKAQLKAQGLLDNKGQFYYTDAKGAETYRKWLNSVLDPTNPKQSRLVGILKDAVDESVLNSGKGDVYDEARFAHQLSKMTFKEPELIDKLLTMTSRTDRVVNYEDVADQIVNKSGIADLKNLKNTLFTGTKGEPLPQAEQAWKDLKSNTFAGLLSKATKYGAPDETGGRVFSGNQFKKALDNIGMDKLKILFDNEELSLLGTLSRRGEELTSPVRGAENNSGTSAAIMNMVQKIYGKAPEQTQAGFVRKVITSKIPGGNIAQGLIDTGKAAAANTIKQQQAAGAANPMQLLDKLSEANNSQASQAALSKIAGFFPSVEESAAGWTASRREKYPATITITPKTLTQEEIQALDEYVAKQKK